MALPLLFAGPILRRVEPRQVAVWVALSAARTVRLSLWRDGVTTGPAPGVFDEQTALAVRCNHVLVLGL